MHTRTYEIIRVQPAMNNGNRATYLQALLFRSVIHQKRNKQQMQQRRSKQNQTCTERQILMIRIHRLYDITVPLRIKLLMFFE